MSLKSLMNGIVVTRQGASSDPSKSNILVTKRGLDYSEIEIEL